MAVPCEEDQVLRLEEWVDVVSMHGAGVPIKGIARTLGVSRNTGASRSAPRWPA